MKETSNLYILVLSNGGYDGLGKEREIEMQKTAKYMGFKEAVVLDEKRIPDGPWKWDTDVQVEVIDKHIKQRAQ